MQSLENIFHQVKEVSIDIQLKTDKERSSVILTLADLVDEKHQFLLEANTLDLEKMDTSNPLYDRLKLTDKRLEDIASDLRKVASLKSPVGEIMEKRTLPNGIELKRVRTPFGVVGIIYEARPNVTFDVFSLCIKSGNACILKGGKDAENSNKAAISLIHEALKHHGFPTNCCVLLPSTHEATSALLNATGLVDVCIPRGGRNLIDFVRNNAKVPVIETGAGVVHVYFDKDGDLSKGKDIIENAKTRRVSVCNALDSLLIHQDRLNDLPELLKPLAEKEVALYTDSKAFGALSGHYPSHLLNLASPSDSDKEWMDYKMGIFVVKNLANAISHIAKHGSGHSESIVTENASVATLFVGSVDASCVYINLPTSFTDGGQFGLGAEIGISTQKLGPRGPMGLKEITTYKYILSGQGQTRP